MCVCVCVCVSLRVYALLVCELLTLSVAHTLCIRVTVGVGEGTAGDPQTCVLTTLAVAGWTRIEKEVVTMTGVGKDGRSPVAFLHQRGKY